MKKFFLILLAIILFANSFEQNKVEWISTTPNHPWMAHRQLLTADHIGKFDVEIIPDRPLQTIEGFGACFNELGWTSLSLLADRDREAIFRELFAPGVGANFTICRMPIGANDFSRHWYSYDETDGDFEIKDFSIANDLETLIPFIKNAQKYYPALRLWASPWSPPSWMKYNKHYAGKSLLGNSTFQSDEWGMNLTGINNGLTPDKEGREGTDMFIQEEKYFKAYSLYFAKFIRAYKQQGIPITMVMPQNEFNSAQVFPSCTWTAAGLSKFIRYLGPQLQNEETNLFFGTVERANAMLADTILKAPSGKYVTGVGFQWAGKDAIPTIHKQYPGLRLYQSEQECGNGKNDWKYCVYAWGLMKHYIQNGANAYMYWNTSLKQGSISTWGWKQNSLVLVDTVHKTFKYNFEYYLLKHLSHFVLPGAKCLQTSGGFSDLLAFKNANGNIIIVAENNNNTEKKITLKVGKKFVQPTLPANSFNTFVLKG